MTTSQTQRREAPKDPQTGKTYCQTGQTRTVISGKRAIRASREDRQTGQTRYSDQTGFENPLILLRFWWAGAELNCRHEDFQNQLAEVAVLGQQSRGGSIGEQHHFLVRHARRPVGDGRPEVLRTTRRSGFLFSVELNCRHEDFQSSALPTELPAHPDELPIPRGQGSCAVLNSYRSRPAVARYASPGSAESNEKQTKDEGLLRRYISTANVVKYFTRASAYLMA